MTFVALLLQLVKPLLGRALVALGFSVVTVTGASVALSSFKPQIVGMLGTGPMAALQLAGLAGCWVGLGAVFGAITFAVTMWGIRKAVSVVGVATGAA